MKTDDIRSAYLDFFAERGHRVVPSSSLVPGNDPTLLFTNAGMVQFKDALTGRDSLDYTRAVSCQRCVRAGGKHNDLDNVGYTGRHQTLFEMLGNFSFGDYFKEDTIAWAWQFVTEVLGLPRDRLWVTVHPTDDEARAIWEKKIGLAADRVVAHEDNFWAMGDTGPCGPDSELFYDLGPGVAGGPPGSPEEEGDRFSEFWNLVFPQFDRAPDGTLTPLASPGVDTGMGLERIAAIVQGGHSNYDNDLFAQLIESTAQATGNRAAMASPSLRVIADHIRASVFLIADGVLPSNEDRGYVLRRIIRRALRHGHKLGTSGPFFHRLVAPVVELMAGAYPLLGEGAGRIESALLAEEERFRETLRSGMALLDQALARLDGGVLPGDVVFKLYDTYGFPADLTEDVARERGLVIDQDGFEARMEEQRQRGRAAASRFDATLEQSVRLDSTVRFCGYSQREGEARIVALLKDGAEVESLAEGEDGVVVLDETPFYAEAGGQIGDTGEIRAPGGAFHVLDTTRGGSQHLHRGRVSRGALRRGDTALAAIDAGRRQAIALNHSATHLLHAALRQELGEHVQQKGSLVAEDRLRFDFSHPRPVTGEELRRMEATVNERIRDNTEVEIAQMDYDEALAKGALALFGEKYGDRVRVLSMGGGFSVELCGGTHVRRTGDIGLLRIVSEEAVAAGVRRIEAVTGAGALAWIADGEQQLGAVGELVRARRSDLGAYASDRGGIVVKVGALQEQTRRLQKELDALKAKLAASQGADLASQAVDVNGVRVLAAAVEADADSLATTMDHLRDSLGDAVVVLASTRPKLTLVSGVSRHLSERLNASEVIRFVGGQVGARGGGRADMARAGGGDPAQLPAALDTVADWVRERTAAG